ncbi:type VI secretion system contractile sheath small subunit [Fundidesulfovibrio terrae]|uniref:type VI secretion system contractile sheath small subunit n=1 Tax=Fundidesulfovibrio terrae TaxID=2922866 RepID=UPI001FAFF088|nr:type VI secretion system contractile sheath small subunit [Fundidesulfovibrio terrae]
MAQEASVAPKERVNIVYKPATGDAKEEVELPLKLLVLGDFTNRADDRTLENREPISVDKDNFDDVLKAQNIELNMTVPNKVSGKDGDELGVHLKFDNLKDFEPDAIVAKVPELQKLMELREALKALKGPLANVPEFRKKVQEMVQDPGLRDRLLKELGIGS